MLATHPENGALGAATVTTPQGSVPLTRAGEGVRVMLGSPPPAPAIVPDAEIQRIFGEALAAMPPPARATCSTSTWAPTPSRPIRGHSCPRSSRPCSARTRPDVSIVGHTDSTDTAAANVALGLRRAGLVRDLLLAAGLGPDLVEVASHGEANPVVPTPDNTAEALNRRVEVTVR